MVERVEVGDGGEFGTDRDGEGFQFSFLGGVEGEDKLEGEQVIDMGARFDDNLRGGEGEFIFEGMET